jgi:hypothetical protein
VCECLEGFLAIPGNENQCAETMAPSRSPTTTPTLSPSTAPTSFAPTISPTHMPTHFHCEEGNTPGCDTTTALAVLGDDSDCYCQCLEGFTYNPVDPTICLVTTAPTHLPTSSPSAHPSPALEPMPTPLPTYIFAVHKWDESCSLLHAEAPRCDTVSTEAVRVVDRCVCLCLPGYTRDLTDKTMTHCLPTMVPTGVPTVSPTEIPSFNPTVPPTSSPSVSPSEMPTKTPCEDDAWDCDTATSMATKVNFDDHVECMCQCLHGFVSDPNDETKCIPTITPTAYPTEATPVPTLSPTHMPTDHPCDDGSHGCDTGSTLPTKAGLGCICVCLEGFVFAYSNTGKYNSKRCAATSSPTMDPTLMPTTPLQLFVEEHPQTPLPTQTPTSEPTLETCADGTHGCDPATTMCVDECTPTSCFFSCVCLEGLIHNVTDVTNCFKKLKIDPTSVPTTSPTMLPTPSKIVGTFAPTNSPSLEPTLEPTNVPCADGTHGCDPHSTECIATVVAGSIVVSCECLVGFYPDASNVTHCFSTLAPTLAPTHLPTWMINVRECKEHTCDPLTSYCAVLTGHGPMCICGEGFHAEWSSGNKVCVATNAPTDNPTIHPTSMPTRPHLPPGQTYSPSAIPTMEPTAQPTNMTLAPTAQPTWAHCSDGEHGCDPESTYCVTIANDGDVLFTCECLEGFQPIEGSVTHCELVSYAPTSLPTTSASFLALPTSIPTLLPTRSPTLINPIMPTPLPITRVAVVTKCSKLTTVSRFEPYCKQPDRNLTVWVRPGMENRRCAGSTILFNVESFKACVEYCAVDQGGPPRCGFFSYDPRNQHCHWSATCEESTIVPNPRTDKENLLEPMGVNQV